MKKKKKPQEKHSQKALPPKPEKPSFRRNQNYGDEGEKNKQQGQDLPMRIWVPAVAAAPRANGGGQCRGIVISSRDLAT